MTLSIQTDVIIIGGGIAGLWTLNRLRNEGFNSHLLEKEKLGQGQTICSQGMIHGGIKYSLSGMLTSASSAIADMPGYWKACIAGDGDIDLRDCNLLSEQYYMWPKNNIRSRLNAFLGSKTLEGRVTKVEPGEYPDFFKYNIPGPLYKLQDIVLDVPSLLSCLSSKQHEYIHKIDWTDNSIIMSDDGNISGIRINNETIVTAKKYILCAGKGAGTLLKQCAVHNIDMQLRPLQMVYVKHNIQFPLYVHCVSDQLSMTPELTITTHTDKDKNSVWYLGGELAEAGANMEKEQLILHTRKKLSELFPWCDFSQAEFNSFHIDRAEEKQPGKKRPDTESLINQGNLMVSWPTKLTLAPNLANTIVQTLKQEITATKADSQNSDLSFLPSPEVAVPPWEQQP